MSFILADGWLITMNASREVLEKTSVCVERNRIVKIGSRQQLVGAHPEAEIVDCAGRIVIPGMVNTHPPVPDSAEGPGGRHGAEASTGQQYDVPAELIEQPEQAIADSTPRAATRACRPSPFIPRLDQASYLAS